jgi:hypothetical protein
MRVNPGSDEYDALWAKVKKAAPKADVNTTTRAEAVNTTTARNIRQPVNTTTRAAPRTEPVNTTTKARPKPEPVNTTKKNARSADRHKEPNRDRHKAGYMAAYMRKWRARAKKKPVK